MDKLIQSVLLQMTVTGPKDLIRISTPETTIRIIRQITEIPVTVQIPISRVYQLQLDHSIPTNAPKSADTTSTMDHKPNHAKIGASILINETVKCCQTRDLHPLVAKATRKTFKASCYGSLQPASTYG